jgi:manganese efflux pump family protein
MTLLAVLFISLGLSLDAFAVAMSVTAAGRSTGIRDEVRLSFHFGLFQFLMPVLGWFAGSAVQPHIERFDHWLVFALLAFVGVRMIRTGFSNVPESVPSNPTRGATMVVLSVATSLDALAVGLSLAFLGVDVVLPSIVIGLVTFAVTYFGMQLGKRLSARYGQKLEIAGGVVLIMIGVKVLAEHLR